MLVKFNLHSNCGKYTKQYTIPILLLCAFLSIVQVSVSQVTESPMKSGMPVFHLSGLYSSKTPFIPSNIDISKEMLWPINFPLDKKHSVESVDKRTLKSRTFTTDDGQIYAQYSLKNINYFDREKKLHPIFAQLNTSTHGWSATRQPNPIYLNTDGSTELFVGNENMKFNTHCKINNQEVNLSDYTVGMDGMFAHQVYDNIDKKIILVENTIETDYIINHPIDLGGNDLVISEEIKIPANYVFKKDLELKPLTSGEERKVAWDKVDEYVVYSPENIQKARFMTPIYYDADHNAMAGKYTVTKTEDSYTMKMVVPNGWLNDPLRKYPITIDPIVYGDTARYDSLFMNSCQFPNYARDSISVLIPANITITAFYIEDSYYASAVSNPQAFVDNGRLVLKTPCMQTGVLTCLPPNPDSSGYCYIVPNSNFNSGAWGPALMCCYSPSCTIDSFYLVHYLARDPLYGPGCNQNFVYYSPVVPIFNFFASIVGHTVETTQNQWFVFPSPVCSDSCTIKLRAITNYGVPPYTLTHPWAVGSIVYGNSVGGCSSTGTDTILLTIPGCPTYCGINQTLSVPPPTIVDVCGIPVLGLLPKNITIHPAPDVTATNVTVCAGTPITIPLISCINTSTFVWTGSNGNNGTGNITDNIASGATVTYTVTPTANGCPGFPATVTATATPQPTASIVSSGTFICGGQPVTITGAGGPPYQWSGGSAATTAAITVSPLTTTTYTLTVGSGLCTDTASVIIQVAAFPVPIVTGNQTICAGQSTTLTASGADTYVWSGGVTSTNASVTVSPAITTTYYVTGTTSCGSSPDTAIVFVNPNPIINSPNQDTTITGGETVQLNAMGGISYIWSGGFSNDLSCIACPNPIAMPLVTTTYTVTGTDANGCTNTDVVTINVLPGEDELYIPNTITPNGNDKNDIFYAYGINIKELNMQVFNKWGELIFESNDRHKGWDGMLNGDYVQMDVYVYVVRCKFNDGKEVKRIGNLNVVF